MQRSISIAQTHPELFNSLCRDCSNLNRACCVLWAFLKLHNIWLLNVLSWTDCCLNIDFLDTLNSRGKILIVSFIKRIFCFIYWLSWSGKWCSTPYNRVSYSDCPSPYGWLSYPNGLTPRSRVFCSECPTPYSRVSYSECPTPYKCVLLRIDIIWSPTPYKNPTPLNAKVIINATSSSAIRMTNRMSR